MEKSLTNICFKDDLNTFAKSEREVERLVSTEHIISNDTEMEFALKVCAVLASKRGCCSVIWWSRYAWWWDDQESRGKLIYKYLSILEDNKIKENKMKDRFQTEYLRKTKLIMKSTLNDSNKIMTMNTWSISLMTYGEGIVRRTKTNLMR